VFAGDEKTNVRVRFWRSGLHGAATEAKRRELAAERAKRMERAMGERK